jgi:hypothetical protein
MDCLPSASSLLLPISSKNDAADENDNDTIGTSNKSKTRKISSVVGAVLGASLSKLSPRRSPKRKPHLQNRMASAAHPTITTNTTIHPDAAAANDKIREQGGGPTFLCHYINTSGRNSMSIEPPSTSTQLLLQDGVLLAEEQTLTQHLNNDTDEDTTLKSIHFAQSLKTYGCISYKERVDSLHQKTVENAVLQFNVMAYLDKCSTRSPHYDASYKLDITASEVFKGGEVWATRELVKDALTAQSNCQGITINRQKDWIGCNRVGEPDKNHDHREFMTGTLKACCTLKMCMKALTKHREKSENKNKYYYKNDWAGPVMFSEDPNKMCTAHGGDCVPSVENKIATAQRAGSFDGHQAAMERRQILKIRVGS